jgi:hypothetical protein
VKNFIVYNSAGIIQRTGICQDKVFFLQADDGEFVIEGNANDVTQKIENPGIVGKVIDKTPEEIEAEKPPEISFEKQPANITNEQIQSIFNRLEALENG